MLPTCRACGSVTVEPINRIVSSTTQLYQCASCQLAFCYPLPPAESLSAGPNSLPTDPGYTAGLLDNSRDKALRYKRLAEGRYQQYSAAIGKSEFRMLEIGCGSCGMALTYSSLGIEYWGIDIDPRVVRLAKESGVANVSKTDCFDIAETAKYDVICFSQVLEHIKEPAMFLDKIASLLAPGGIVHCDVPNHHSLPSLLYRAPINPRRWGGITYPHHLYAYTKKSLSALFSRLFTVDVFNVTVDDRVWGQAIHENNQLALFSPLLKALNAGSLLVAYGAKKAV